MSTILVADDERNIREVLAAFLQDEGYTVRTALDGRQALRVMEAERPDLLLMDCMMPELDGREVLHEMRRRPELASIPVVLMSSADPPSPEVLGSAAFLPKPFALDHLLQTVAQFVPAAP